MKSFHRGISRFKLYAIFIGVILIVIITMCSCPGTATYTPTEESTTPQEGTTQIIDYFMQAAPIDGDSVVNYTKVLNAGDNVSGYALLVGEWELAGDWRTPWFFKALSPSGEVLDSATVQFHVEGEETTYYFDLTAPTQGVYTIQISHISCFPQDVHIEIQPPGWEFSGN